MTDLPSPLIALGRDRALQRSSTPDDHQRGVAERRRFTQTATLEERLAEDTERLRQQAKALKPGVARDNVLRRIRQNKTARDLSEWLVSPGLKAPT